MSTRLLAVEVVLVFLLAPSPSLSNKVVTHLPGFQGPLPFYLETGYVTVDEANGSELFYYFIESERDPRQDPVVLWITGGPRCSALSGLVFEIGPLKFVSAEYNGSLPNLIYHPYAWTKGYVIGNPATGEKIDITSRVAFSHGVGIISDQLYELIERSCEGQDHRTPSSAQCAEHLDAFYNLKSEVWQAYILDPWCPDLSPRPKGLIQGRRSILDHDQYLELSDPPIHPPLKCKSYKMFLLYYWANSNLTRDDLGIRKGTVPEWLRCKEDLPYRKDIASSLEYHVNLTTRGYRALVYSGDHDLMIPFVGTQKWIRSLNFSVTSDWRSWKVYGQVAGYSITYSNNLTFATVKNAGHEAPTYKAKECFMMFKRWISHKPL